jgi:hypothetical protein
MRQFASLVTVVVSLVGVALDLETGRRQQSCRMSEAPLPVLAFEHGCAATMAGPCGVYCCRVVKVADRACDGRSTPTRPVSPAREGCFWRQEAIWRNTS